MWSSECVDCIHFIESDHIFLCFAMLSVYTLFPDLFCFVVLMMDCLFCLKISNIAGKGNVI